MIRKCKTIHNNQCRQIGNGNAKYLTDYLVYTNGLKMELIFLKFNNKAVIKAIAYNIAKYNCVNSVISSYAS